MGEGASSSFNDSDNCYFTFPTGWNVFGANDYGASGNAEQESHFTYYQTADNRIKKLGNTGIAITWWERTSADYQKYCCVDSEGTASAGTANYNYGIAPFGFI